MSLRLLLSDADNTLFDFARGEDIAVHTVFPRFGVEPTPENLSLYNTVNGGLWKKLEAGQITASELEWRRFADFLRVLGMDESLAPAFAEAYSGQLALQRDLMPGAESFCKTISANLHICLVTNGIAHIQHSRFEESPLFPCFSGLVISQEVGFSKPDPQILYAAMEQMGVTEKSEVLLLGDSLSSDIAAAQNADIRSILYTNGKPAPEGHGATYTAATLADAAAIILKLQNQ